MARIRSIKPEFWSDEKIVELDFEWRLLFQGIWNFADDQGFIDCSPKRIKMQVFPGDNVDVSRGLTILLESSLLKAFRLRSAPERYVLRVVNWSQHQRVSNPAKPRFTSDDLEEVPQVPDLLGSPREDSRVLGKGREGIGRDTAPNGAGASAPTPTDINPGSITGAWVDAFTAPAGRQAPSGGMRGQVGREVKRLLDGGAVPALVLDAARRAGEKGYPTIEREYAPLVRSANGTPGHGPRLAKHVEQ